jgi:hypothetical protein
MPTFNVAEVRFIEADVSSVHAGSSSSSSSSSSDTSSRSCSDSEYEKAQTQTSSGARIDDLPEMRAAASTALKSPALFHASVSPFKVCVNQITFTYHLVQLLAGASCWDISFSNSEAAR